MERKLSDRKLIVLLKELSSVELNQFERYLASYLCDHLENSDTLITIIKVIRNSIIEVSDTRLIPTPEALYRSVYGRKEYNRDTLYTAFSKLWDEIFRFFALEQFGKEKNRHPKLAMMYLNDRCQPLGDKLTPVEKFLRRKVERTTPDSSSEYFLNNFELLFSIGEQLQFFPAMITINRWEELHHFLDASYFAKKLEILIGERSFGMATGRKGTDSPVTIEILKIIEANFKSLPNLIAAYYYSYCLYSNDDAVAQFAFKNLFRLVIKESLDCPPEEKKTFFTSLFNYTVNKVNCSILEYHPIADELINFGINSEVIFHNGNISSRKLKTIITFKCRVGKQLEARKILENMEGKVIDLDKEMILELLRAILEYYEESFESSISRLELLKSGKKFDEWRWNLEARIFEVMARFGRYSENDYYLLPNRIENTFAYIRRNKKLSDSARIGYKYFLDFFQNINIIFERKDRKKLEALQLELHTSKLLPNKQWLVELANWLDKTLP